MTENVRYGLDNPQPFSQMKTEMIWEGRYITFSLHRSSLWQRILYSTFSTSMKIVGEVDGCKLSY